MDNALRLASTVHQLAFVVNASVPYDLTTIRDYILSWGMRFVLGPGGSMPPRLKAMPCYFCGQEAGTKDHVPPKVFFASERKSLITVAACQKHNNGFSRLDIEAFAVYALSASSSDPRTHAKIMRILEKDPALRVDIEKRTLRKGHFAVMKVDLAKLRRFSDRVFKGVYRHETGETYLGATIASFPTNVSTDTGWFNLQALDTLERILSWLRSVPVKGENAAFRYRFARSTDGPSAILMFSLLGAIVIVSTNKNGDTVIH